jgi:hypothetical protein
MLDIRQLHYFVAVAEEEHVGRAAERLHISQSPLSRQIAQLEEKLGLTLFERSQQRIRLTRRRPHLPGRGARLLTHANRLESLARRLGRGDEGGLCIGYIENAMHSGVLPMRCAPCAPRGRRCTSRCTTCSRRSSWKGCASAAWTSRWSANPPPPTIPTCKRATAERSDAAGAARWRIRCGREGHRPDDLAGQEWIAVRTRKPRSRTTTSSPPAPSAGFTPEHLDGSQPSRHRAGTGGRRPGRGDGAAAVCCGTRRRRAWCCASCHGSATATPLWAAWHRVNLRPLVEVFRMTLLEGARPESRPAL